MHLHAHHASVEQAIAALYPRLDALVVLTSQDAQEYAAAVTHPVRVVVIPNTVRPLGGARPTLSEPAVIAAGRLTPQKGFDMLIRAFAQVAAERADWELRICGAGRERGTLEALIHEMRLGDHVTLRGPVKRLGEEMSRASIFVLSSRFEGFPLVLVEAMSTGLPVVSFDCPTGPRDVIDHRGNGILVPPGDVDALARAMLELIADEDLRRRMGAAAARTATAYTIDAIGPRWSQLLDSLPPPSNVPASTAGRSANGGLDPVTAAPAAVRRPGAGA
jgi:glycosyltransferase involved in cell wall biosynthesis